MFRTSGLACLLLSLLAPMSEGTLLRSFVTGAANAIECPIEGSGFWWTCWMHTKMHTCNGGEMCCCEDGYAFCRERQACTRRAHVKIQKTCAEEAAAEEEDAAAKKAAEEAAANQTAEEKAAAEEAALKDAAAAKEDNAAAHDEAAAKKAADYEAAAKKSADEDAAVAEAEAVLEYYASQKRLIRAFGVQRGNSTALSDSNATANASGAHPNGIYGDARKEYVQSIWAAKKEELHKAVLELNATKQQLSYEKYTLDSRKKQLPDEKAKLDPLKKLDPPNEKLVAAQQGKIDKLEKQIPQHEEKIPKLEKKIKEQQGKVDKMRVDLITKKKLIGNKFEPQCAKVLNIMVDRRSAALYKLDLTDESLGLDMATHFQVQCPGSIPMPEDKCDKYATSLGKLIDDKWPIIKKASLLQKPAPPQSGNEWCTSFFSDFFNAIFHLVGCFEQGQEEQ